ncbi:MAG TPA: D-alanine--D-alanine ligase [Coriobacteriia bacterium]|nr:D-alanine--D-alanine ligase [Coriobacteriia bacterium]
MPIVPTDIRVALLVGGRSAEREVSLNSGRQVAEALMHSGFDVVEIDTGSDEFIAELSDANAHVVFICLHGRFGEDGTVQGLCELLELPYVGSGVLASALAMDKVMSKHVFAQAGLSSPDYRVLRRGDEFDLADLTTALGPKTVVKPANEGSAIGVTIAHGPDELPAAIVEAFRYDSSILVERFVSGAEVTVGVIGNERPEALPTLEIVPEHEFYDYDSKYLPGMSRHIIPARVSQEARSECVRLSLEAHVALGCRGMSRADTIVEEDGTVWLLEVNTIPGMTPTSLLPDAARAAGMEFPELCRRLVELALEPRR